jgi:hypothetical protein
VSHQSCQSYEQHNGNQLREQIAQITFKMAVQILTPKQICKTNNQENPLDFAREV